MNQITAEHSCMTCDGRWPLGPDISETTDPTVDQEEALRKAQEEAQEAMEGEEEPEESDEDWGGPSH